MKTNTGGRTESSVALDVARARRRTLHAALAAAEDAIASPARAGGWTAMVTQRARDLAAALAGHVDATEGPGGLFDQVLALAPRLAHDIQRLRAEHIELQAETRRLIDELASGRGGPSDVEGLRAEVLHLLHEISRHRQAGSDLVWEAYAVDIGGG